MIRCKFRCDAIEPAWGGQAAECRDRKVTLTAVSDGTVPEDLAFTSFAPGDHHRRVLTMAIDNPAALAQLQVGGFYYLDLTPVLSARDRVPGPADPPRPERRTEIA